MEEKLICKVCGEEFEDGWSHALVGPGLLRPKDEAHATALKAFEGQLYEGYCPFCGWEVRTMGSASPDGDASWETSCMGCGFLFDED